MPPIVVGVTNRVSAVIGGTMLVRKGLRFTMMRDDRKPFKMWVRSADALRERRVPARMQARVSYVELWSTCRDGRWPWRSRMTFAGGAAHSV